jgi:Yip1-like protein
MSMSQETIPQGDEPPGVSETSRVWGVFFSPVRTFHDIARRPTWLVPVLVVAGAHLLSSLMVLPKFDWERTIVEGMEQSGQKVPEGKMDTIVHVSKAMGWIAGLAGSFLYPVAVSLVCALVYFAIIRVFRGRISYRGAFSICCFALLPAAIPPLIVAAASIRWTSVVASDLQHVVPSTLGYFLPRDAGPALSALGQRIDLFSFWSLALAVVGLSSVSSWSRGKCAVLALGFWAFMGLGAVGWAAGMALLHR